MKQTPLRRKTPLKTKRRRWTTEQKLERQAFHDAVKGLVCAVCDQQGCQWGHHAVYEQHCPHGAKNDPRNAFPACNFCHGRHHDGSEFKIPRACLSETNLQFANDVLGPGAGDYLRRRYA